MNFKTIRLRLPAMMMAASVFMGVQIAPAQGVDPKPMLRLICATSVGEGQEVVLATKSEDGKWKKLAAVELRAPLVSEWLPSHAGEIHITVKEKGKLESICHFTHPAGASHALVILTADEATKTYRSYTVDPGKDGFGASNALIINASEITGSVSVGTESVEIEAGRHVVVKPEPDENGGYRLMVKSPDPQGEKQLCYDRHATANAKSRNIIVLLPDPSLNLRVVSISEFDLLE